MSVTFLTYVGAATIVGLFALVLEKLEGYR